MNMEALSYHLYWFDDDWFHRSTKGVHCILPGNICSHAKSANMQVPTQQAVGYKAYICKPVTLHDNPR